MISHKQISVIMPVYNETIHDLHDSILSIREQTYTNFEFVIVDDNPGSTIIKNYLLNEQSKDNRIRLIFNKKNLGAMKSANIALQHSHGKFIAKMDADDISKRDRLQKQLTFCKNHDLDFVCCNYCDFINSITDNQSAYSSITQANQVKMKRVLSHINIAMGPTLFFKREIIDTIGKYRDILCEDYDLAVRALSYGYQLGYLSNVLVYKRNRVNNISKSNNLEEFVTNDSIGKYVREYDFKEIVPLTYIKNCLKNIKQSDKEKYSMFIKYSEQCEKSKNIFNIIGKYFYGLSSPLMIKRSFIAHFSRLIQTILLK